jgi:hypothetical protein
MNPILERLSGGSLISDGDANEVAEEILLAPKQLNQLIEGLSSSDDVIRGRTAHALEWISRSRPDLLLNFLPLFLQSAKNDPVPMVRWHLAMLFANLTVKGKEKDQIVSTLFDLLQDDSIFIKSWAISSLCILGRKYPEYETEILEKIKPLRNYQSVAIRTRAKKAIEALENPYLRLPKSWVKSNN